MPAKFAPTVTLHNGVEIPQLGLGLYQSKDGDEVVNAIKWAAQAGYRHFDTASFYGNEAGVGAGLKACGVRREELFVTTKVWNADHGYDKTLAAFERSRQLLGLEYIDLYLIHWPGPDSALMCDTWRALEKLYEEKKVRVIGVSNFEPHHLDTLLAACKVRPMMNQVEMHPLFQQGPLRAYCKEKGIAVTAWRPLGKGAMLSEPKIVALAEKNKRTPAQIILRSMMQQGIVTIPKSVTKERIEANFDIFDFTLSDEDMQVMASLNEEKRTGGHPDTFWPL